MAYADVIEVALYHPQHGFYTSGGMAGRRGDFITSPEVGPLFGHVVANALDAEWDRLGQPEFFTVVDYGAGPGTLARSVAAASPRCESSMRYLAIERSARQRELHPSGVISADSLTAELLGDELVGVVVANELLDNLAFAPVVRTENGLRYVEVSIDDDGSLTSVASSRVLEDDVFDDDVAAAVVQNEAAMWLRHVTESMSAGRVLVMDYCRLSSNDVEIRTFASHGMAGDPLSALGTKDITVDVDLEQLQRTVTPATQIMSQSSWLKSHGLDRLVSEGRSMWDAGASTGSLAALKARSRVREAEALTEVGGLGGFTVAEWVVS